MGFSHADFSFKKFPLVDYKGHESISYAFEFIPDSNLILTSSFYDCNLHLLGYY